MELLLSSSLLDRSSFSLAWVYLLLPWTQLRSPAHIDILDGKEGADHPWAFLGAPAFRCVQSSTQLAAWRRAMTRLDP